MRLDLEDATYGIHHHDHWRSMTVSKIPFLDYFRQQGLNSSVRKIPDTRIRLLLLRDFTPISK